MENQELLKRYNEEEIKELLNNDEKLVYVDTGMEEIVVRYKDLPDVIVDVNNKLGSTNLKIYDYDNPSSTPTLTTIGFFLDRCEQEIRKDIIDRLINLQQGVEETKDYKVIDEDMLDDAKKKMDKGKKPILWNDKEYYDYFKISKRDGEEYLDNYLQISRYNYNDELYLGVVDEYGEIWGDISINLDGMYKDNNEIFLQECLSDFTINKFKELGIIENVENTVNYNMGNYKVATLNFDKLKEYDPKGYLEYIEDIEKQEIEDMER